MVLAWVQQNANGAKLTKCTRTAAHVIQCAVTLSRFASLVADLDVSAKKITFGMRLGSA